jgi:DNA topoisomerase-1
LLKLFALVKLDSVFGFAMKSQSISDPSVNGAVITAEEAGVHYTVDTEPGIRRLRRGRGVVYMNPANRAIRDKATLQRIAALGIPPAWTDVWICPSPTGHLQATGRDSRGRKQYRYHDQWTAWRDELKYERMIEFATALPRVRRRVARDLKRRGLPREKVLAAIVRLMDRTSIRIGSEEYSRTNKSYGMATLQDRHVQIRGSEMHFKFRGKSGKMHEIGLEDKELAKIVRDCHDLPGQELFQYLDDDGNVCDVTSRDINDYLREVSGQDFTAKDFRTWAGTTIAFEVLSTSSTATSARAAKRNVLAALDCVAKKLGNTRAVCRKSYVHPALFETYMVTGAFEVVQHRNQRTGLTTIEANVAVLFRHLWRSQRSLARQGAK